MSYVPHPPPDIDVADHAIFGATNPIPGALRSRTWTRTLECERLLGEQGVRRYPGIVKPPPARGGEFIRRSAVICRQRLMRDGLRAPGDEALLMTLEPMTVTLVEAAASLRPDLSGATWLVEASVPNPVVGTKVAFATKNALMERGLTVSDRMPLLGHGDVDVITRLAPEEAYPAACLRWAATGSIREGDAVLAVVVLDPRETVLHAGVCVDGAWSWLR